MAERNQIGSSESFEIFKDRFFINPDGSNLQEFAVQAYFLIMGMGGAEGASIIPDKYDFIKQMVTERRENGRLFDGLAVDQLLPTDNIPALLGNFAGTFDNHNGIISAVSPYDTELEKEAITWIGREIVGYDMEGTTSLAGLKTLNDLRASSTKGSGSIVTGGTSANLHALAVARERLESQGWNGTTPTHVLTSPMAHYSVYKSARTLAPGDLIKTGYVDHVEGGYKIDPEKLRDKIIGLRKEFGKHGVMAVVALAGETETGLVDDLNAIANITDELGVYLHVDGAYGAPYVLSRREHLFDGMSRADSVTCDPHKYMYIPYNAGAIFFRDYREHNRIANFNSYGDGYMWQDEQAGDTNGSRYTIPDIRNPLNNGQRKLEGSMGGYSAASTYYSAQELGVEGYRTVLNHTLDMAEYFASIIREQDGPFELLLEPELNTVNLIPKGDDIAELDKKSDHLCEVLKNNGVRVSNTRFRVDNVPRKVLRVIPTHPHTQRTDMDHVAENLTEAWENLK